MEKEIVWTEVAQKDLQQIVSYLNDTWPAKVLERFHKLLLSKTRLLVKQLHIGFQSKKHSKYRRTLVTRHYMLIYSVNDNHIIIHRVKHVSLK